MTGGFWNCFVLTLSTEFLWMWFSGVCTGLEAGGRGWRIVPWLFSYFVHCSVIAVTVATENYGVTVLAFTPHYGSRMRACGGKLCRWRHLQTMYIRKKKFLHKIPSRLTEGRLSSDSEPSITGYVGAAVFMHHVGKLWPLPFDPPVCEFPTTLASRARGQDQPGRPYTYRSQKQRYCS